MCTPCDAFASFLAGFGLRDTYDRFGEEGLKRTEQGGSADPFGDMFSHFGFGGGRRQREESRTPNVEVSAR